VQMLLLRRVSNFGGIVIELILLMPLLHPVCLQFVLFLLISGVRKLGSTGFFTSPLFTTWHTANMATMTAWLPYFLHVNPIWKSKAITEVKSLLMQHSNRSLPLAAQLASLPVSTLTGSTPILDACLRETIRLVFSTTLLRKNRGGNVEVGGVVVEGGEFLAYQAADVHMDERLYPGADK
jgi:hypothetical protein